MKSFCFLFSDFLMTWTALKTCVMSTTLNNWSLLFDNIRKKSLTPDVLGVYPHL